MMKKKLNTWLTSILAGISALSILGGVLPMFASKTASAATETQVIKPYIEYTFDSVENFTKNTGKSASDGTKDYSLVINGNATAYDLQYDGYANFSENASLYIPMENNPFISDLTDFTITVDVNAKKAVRWYSSVFSWDSFTSYDNKGI